MNKKISVLIIALVLVGVATAGAVFFLFPYEPTNPPIADDSLSSPEGVAAVVAANNEFGFDMYHTLSESNTGNMFYSPYSLSTALIMSYEGANGKTETEMRDVLHLPEDNILRPNAAAIYNGLNKKSTLYSLHTGNALWAQFDYDFLDEYTNRVEQFYGGKVSNVDFYTQTEESRKTINTFIEAQTNKKIVDLIPPGALVPRTKLVLTNAVYFKGDWKWVFEKSDTQDKEFFVTPDNPVITPMMHMKPDEARFNYANLEKLKILELPYKGDELSMLILLPKQGEEYDFETGEVITFENTLDDVELTAKKLVEYKNAMKETNMNSISLPSFEFDSKYFMGKHLKTMGMPTAFTSDADFSGMTGNKDLFIDKVIHQAYVKVDEKGTEAAAATAVIMVEKSAMGGNYNVFNANHPFVFIIQENDTGNILFIGRVSNPTLEE